MSYHISPNLGQLWLCTILPFLWFILIFALPIRRYILLIKILNITIMNDRVLSHCTADNWRYYQSCDSWNYEFKLRLNPFSNKWLNTGKTRNRSWKSSVRLRPCLHVTFYFYKNSLLLFIAVSMVMGWITDRIGDDPFCPLFIDTIPNNNVWCKQYLTDIVGQIPLLFGHPG